jgi:hypothetical protein
MMPKSMTFVQSFRVTTGWVGIKQMLRDRVPEYTPK